jgi:hypothetical protein
MIDIDDKWLAGVLEGKCTFTTTVVKNGSETVTVKMLSTRYDLLERVQEVAGIGKIYHHERKDSDRKQWSWQFSRRQDVKALLERIRPYVLSDVIADIDECLSVIDRYESKRTLPKGVYRAEGKTDKRRPYRVYYKSKYVGSYYSVGKAKAAYEDAAREVA